MTSRHASHVQPTLHRQLPCRYEIMCGGHLIQASHVAEYFDQHQGGEALDGERHSEVHSDLRDKGCTHKYGSRLLLPKETLAKRQLRVQLIRSSIH